MKKTKRLRGPTPRPRPRVSIYKSYVAERRRVTINLKSEIGGLSPAGALSITDVDNLCF